MAAICTHRGHFSLLHIEHPNLHSERRVPVAYTISGNPQSRLASTGMILFPSLLNNRILRDVQFYMSCAQIKVTGGGSAVPSPTATIPGAFRSTDPGYTANVRCALRYLMWRVAEIIHRFITVGPPIMLSRVPRWCAIDLSIPLEERFTDSNL